jgi:hypothetical protein
MKAKNQLTMLILVACLMVTGIVYGDNPLLGTSAASISSGSGTNMGWQEHTSRQTLFYSDGLNVSTGGGVDASGFSWNINFSTNITRIECCQPATLIQSWCNYNADDPGCPN